MSSKELPKTKTIINHRFLRQLFTKKNQHQNNRPTLGRKKFIWKISVPIETSSVCTVTQCRTRGAEFLQLWGDTSESDEWADLFNSWPTCYNTDKHAHRTFYLACADKTMWANFVPVISTWFGNLQGFSSVLWWGSKL